MKYIFFSLIVCINVLSSYSQTKNNIKNDEDLIIDSLFDEEADKEVDDLLTALFKEQKDLDDLMASFSDFKFLYISTNYTSDTYFAGRDIGLSEYNFRPQITYLDAKGIFASVGGAYFRQFDPKWDFTSLSLGYGKSFGKNNMFRASASYTRFIYNQSGLNPFTNSVALGLTLRNKKRTLGTRLSLNESFGDESVFQLAFSGFGVVNILNKDKYRLQFRPRLSIIAGQQQTYEDSGAVELIEEEGILYEIPKYEEKEIFDLMNIQINLPLLYSTEKWDVEIGFNTNFPHEIGEESKLKNTNFINISIGYLLEL